MPRKAKSPDPITVIALDHVTLRWEEPINWNLAFSLAVMTNDAEPQRAPEIGKAFGDLVLHGQGALLISFDDDFMPTTKHVPWRDFSATA